MKQSFLKRYFSIISVVLLLICLPVSSFATDDSRCYEFDLKANGEYELSAELGDILTFTLNLKQTGGNSNEIYAFQTEILYDSSCLRLVEKSSIAAQGLEAHDVELPDGMHAYYINFVSMVGGEKWDQDTLAGTFQMEVIDGQGEISVQNTNYKVSTADGSDSYLATAQDVIIRIRHDRSGWDYLLLLLIILLLSIFLYLVSKKRKRKGKHEKKRS